MKEIQVLGAQRQRACAQRFVELADPVEHAPPERHVRADAHRLRSDRFANPTSPNAESAGARALVPCRRTTRTRAAHRCRARAATTRPVTASIDSSSNAAAIAPSHPAATRTSSSMKATMSCAPCGLPCSGRGSGRAVARGRANPLGRGRLPRQAPVLRVVDNDDFERRVIALEERREAIARPCRPRAGAHDDADRCDGSGSPGRLRSRPGPPRLIAETERTERRAGGFRQHDAPARRRRAAPIFAASALTTGPIEPPPCRDQRPRDRRCSTDALGQHAVHADAVAEHARPHFARRCAGADARRTRPACRR